MFKKMSTKKKQKSAANWDYLPEHLLEDVLDRFVEVSDYVRFSVVCKRWLSAAQFHQNQWRLKSSQKQTPMLLVDHNIGSVKNLSLHSVVVGKHQLLINKAANLHVPDFMYNDINIRSCGSSHGWLIITRKDTCALILYNPFTKSTINLPPIFDVSKEEPPGFALILERLNKKVFLSEDPSLYPDTYQVLILYTLNFMWLFRSRSDSWVRVRSPQIPDADIRLIDRYFINPHAIYYRGKFYIAGHRSLTTVETTNDDKCCAPRAIYRYLGFQQPPNITQIFGLQYLVESCDGRLLYIERYDYEFKLFNVFEVNLNHEDNPMCSLVPTLGGETLFLGLNYSFSLLGSSCQPDCIYHAHDYTCVYDVLHRNTKRLSPWSIGVVSAIWIVPHANLNTSYNLVAD